MRGFLSQADLNALYAESHLFLHPSEMTSDQNQEGVPNSMLEAMATGLPVIATWHGGIPEAVTHERDGLAGAGARRGGALPGDAPARRRAGEWARFGRGGGASRCGRNSSKRGRSPRWRSATMRRWRSAPRARARMSAARRPWFAYLFERFPSFVQTFCYREAEEMARQGMAPLVDLDPPAGRPAGAGRAAATRAALSAGGEGAARGDRPHARTAAASACGAPSRSIARSRDSQRIFEAAWLAPRAARARHPARARALWRDGRAHRLVAARALRHPLLLHRPRERYLLRKRFSGHERRPRARRASSSSPRRISRARGWRRSTLARGEKSSAFSMASRRMAFPPRRPPGAVPRILSVGRYVEKKGFADLIEACRLLRDARAFRSIA